METNLKNGTVLQNGKYTILKTLGQGGFGITYLAQQELMDRRVCIKEFYVQNKVERESADETCLTMEATTLIDDSTELLKEQFIGEAQKIALLNHPNIVTIHDVFREKDSAYYVMEYIDGSSLSDMIKKRGKLSQKESVRYIKQIGEALEYLHERNMMHLDVKPGNIMIDSKGRAVLIDFGMSKRYDNKGEQAQNSSELQGLSEGYAPPEQYVRSGITEFTPQIDIYSLGATLYKAVSGVTPPSSMKIVSKGIKELDVSISPNIRKAVAEAMKLSTKERLKSVSEFLDIIAPKINVSETKKDLEKLINAAVVDGKITDKEQKVIMAKAQQIGITFDEVKIILDSKLYSHNSSERNNQVEKKSAENSPIEGMSSTQKDLKITITDINVNQSYEMFPKISAKCEILSMYNQNQEIYLKILIVDNYGNVINIGKPKLLKMGAMPVSTLDEVAISVKCCNLTPEKTHKLNLIACASIGKEDQVYKSAPIPFTLKLQDYFCKTKVQYELNW